MSAQTSPVSPAAANREPVAALSLRLWDLDWSQLLPWKLDEGVSAELGTFDQAELFIEEHYGEIFPTEKSSFLKEPMSEAKRRFCAEMDVFLFRAEGQTVGIFTGHPTDWSTYYIRSVAFIREYRARGLMRRFVMPLWGALRAAGVARVESDISPSNVPTLGLHFKEGFTVTSNSNSERWGSTLRLTKFLRRESEEVFSRQFCTLPIHTNEFDPNQDRSQS